MPVVSTAFRPVEADELARNPFRVFTSVLTPADRRFFSADLQARLETFLAGRELFGPELLDLAARAEADGGLGADDAERFLALATAAFELSPEPVDRAWYDELEAVSAVAADIGGVRSTHVNHLTPRVLDIDALYARMGARGITMIDDIQGPPAWEGPDVLLRQTSFRALAEPRAFRLPDGTVTRGDLRVRFGEVEARGVALTRAGPGGVRRGRRRGGRPRPAHGGGAAGGARRGVAPVVPGHRGRACSTPGSPTPSTGWSTGSRSGSRSSTRTSCPQSAAGIFASNLSADATTDATAAGVELDEAWLAGAMGRDVHDPFELYAAQAERSRSAPG